MGELSTTKAGEITQILAAHQDGDRQAFAALLPLVYDDLRLIARRQLRSRKQAKAMDSGSLVHEAYVKLVNRSRLSIRDRQHFFALAARAMRQVVVDLARHYGRRKRGAGVADLSFDEALYAVQEQSDLVLAVAEALDTLKAIDVRLAEIVDCRFFAGYSEEETAEVVDVSVRTVQRDWARARGWLREMLRSDEPQTPL